jgi:hypothetical protein
MEAERMTADQDKIRAWAFPITLTIIGLLVTVVGTLGLTLWNNQQSIIVQQSSRISALETTLATVTENQRQGAADRTAFQDATTRRLNEIQSAQVTMGLILERLTTLQEREATRP